MPTLRDRVLRGSLWITFGFGASQIIRLGSNIILARLLFEEAFALMAVVNAVIQGLTMFSDIGLGPSVIQNKRGNDRDFLNTAWTLQVLRGVLLAGVATAAALPVAQFYAKNDPQAMDLAWLIPIVAFSALISGFASSKLWTATRHMSLARPALIEFVGQLCSLTVMITIAVQTRSILALAAGSVVSATVTMALTHLILDGERNRFRLEKASVIEIIHFGKWVFLSTLITFLAAQLDRLTFARLFDLDRVGVYAIAASLIMVIPDFLSRLQGMVAFPAFSRVLESLDSLQEVFDRSKRPLLLATSYLIALAIAGAHAFVTLAYDDRYSEAAFFIQMLAIGAWFSATVGTYFSAFLATGRVKFVASVNATKVAALAALVVPGALFGGFPGAVAAVVAAEFLKFLAAAWHARAMGLTGALKDSLYLVFSVSVGTAVFLATSAVMSLSERTAPLVLLAQGVGVSLCFAPLAAQAWRSLRSARQPQPDASA